MRSSSIRRRPRASRRALSLITATMLIGGILPVFLATPALAVDDPDAVNVSLTACDFSGPQGDPSAYDPDNDDLLCADDDYSPGNLGKLWNELDLVPFRVSFDAGNNAPATQTFRVVIVLDREDGGKPGYDVLSTPVLNDDLSDASCAVSSGPESELSPGVGGIDVSIYRTVDITVDAGDECVIDYYGRLAVGSHEFPGSSLHANLLNQAFGTGGVGAQDRSIPVNEIEPQELDKDMTATQDAEHIWNITKTPSPAILDIDNTCDPASDSATVDITVEWEKLPASPSGGIDVVTNIYATNPAARSVLVDVTDDIRSGTTVLDSEVFPQATVPKNTANYLIGTHTTTVPAGTTDLNDVATASYTDEITGVEIPGQTTATASATVQSSGTTLDQTATITDVEGITGTGLTFSVDSTAGASGSFGGGYVAGTATVGPVSWTSDTQSDSGSVTFHKTVYAAEGTSTNDGLLTDTATLTGSDGFSAEADAEVDITSAAYADLTIEKTLTNNPLEGDETATFSFEVKDSADVVVDTVDLVFGAGDVMKSEVLEDLTLDVYTVTETAPSGWSPSDPIDVDLTGDACEGTASFTNSFDARAGAEVKKVTSPAGFEADWTFELFQDTAPAGPGPEDAPALESVTTTDGSFTPFSTQLGEGDYYILEAEQDGWTSDGGNAGCTFSVNLPADADTTFQCTFTNTYVPSVTLLKDGDDLSKGGDTVNYTFDVDNTGSAGGAAGAPDLDCVVTDDTIGYTSDPFTLAPGTGTILGPIEFEIPEANFDDDEFVNEAIVECTYPGLDAVVASNDDDFTTNLFQPSIDVTKSGPTDALVGDTVTYSVEIENTSSEDSPTLVVEAIEDSLAGDITPVSGDDCYELDGGATPETCTLTYDYTIQAGDVVDGTVSNTVDVTYNPDGFPNDVEGSSGHDVNILAPSFTIQKVCKADTEPVPIEGPAVFTVTVENTGNVALSVDVGDGIGVVDLAVGESKSFDVSVDGPFDTETVSNEVSATATIAGDTEFAYSEEKSANAECRVGSRVNVQKLANGAPAGAGDPSFTFAIYDGPDGFDSGEAPLVTDGTPPAVMDFGDYNLDPTKTYTLCEQNVPAGWTSMWKVDTDGDGVADAVINPYNPNADDVPAEDLGNRCVEIGDSTDFPLTGGGTLVFEVDNSFPGGEPRTPGYWKNWSSCTSGGQYANALAQGGGAGGFWTLDELLNNPGFTLGLMVLDGDWDNDKFLLRNATGLPQNDCKEAVRILNKSDAGSGKKKANDAAYELATMLFAAQLNLAAGAETCDDVQDAVNAGQALLVAIGFDGDGDFLGPKVKGAKLTQRAQALALAKTLDQYNNGSLCT